MLRILPIPAFNDNYIWMLQESGCAVVVDPGDAVPVLSCLHAASLRLAAILVTHHHYDHTGGIAELYRRLGAPPVYAPAGESIPDCTVRVQGGDRIEIKELSISFQAVNVPGHTAGAIAYVGHGVLFSGDTLFTGGCGRLFEGTPQQMHGSLMRLAALPDDTLVYCGHEYTLANLEFASRVEPENADIRDRLAQVRVQRARGEPTVPATLGLEHLTNPFLRCAEPAVRLAAEAWVGRPLKTPAAVLAAIREWKNELS